MVWIWFIVIGALAGWLAGLVTRGRGFGILGDFILGVIGALIGGFLFRLIGLASYGLIGSLVTATVGAIVLLALVRMLKSA